MRICIDAREEDVGAAYIWLDVDGWGGRTVPEVKDGELVIPEHTSRMVDRFERHKRHSYVGQEHTVNQDNVNNFLKVCDK